MIKCTKFSTTLWIAFLVFVQCFLHVKSAASLTRRPTEYPTQRPTAIPTQSPTVKTQFIIALPFFSLVFAMCLFLVMCLKASWGDEGEKSKTGEEDHLLENGHYGSSPPSEHSDGNVSETNCAPTNLSQNEDFSFSDVYGDANEAKIEVDELNMLRRQVAQLSRKNEILAARLDETEKELSFAKSPDKSVSKENGQRDWVDLGDSEVVPPSVFQSVTSGVTSGDPKSQP